MTVEARNDSHTYQDASGRQVESQGVHIVAGGGGGGGDASAANQVTTNDRVGALTETAPASDTASSGLNGRLQRIAQRLTSLTSLFPASLGRKAAAASFGVALSTEDLAALSAISGGGGVAPSVSSNVSTVGTSAGELRPANAARTLLHGQNLGPGILYLDENGTAPVIGDSYKIAVDGTFDIYSNEQVQAIASLAATKVRWTENA